jgi:hypothetical protein
MASLSCQVDRVGEQSLEELDELLLYERDDQALVDAGYEIPVKMVKNDIKI